MFPEWLKRDGGFPVKITGYNATTHAHDWTLQIIEPDGSMTADTRTISGGSLFELNDQQVATDSYIFARWAGLDAGGMSVFMCAKGGTGAVRPVTLLKTSGADGTASTACAYVYTVTDAITTTVLATGVTPEHNRPYGKTVSAIRGMAWMEGATCHLILTDEIPNKKACV
jgi:hypothetical protein